MGILTKSDYEKILNYYNIPFSTSDSSKQIKSKAEEILADKLCKCIKKVKEDTNDPDKDASEVFVHHSAVTVSQEQYRYLVEGEYVEFSVVTTETGDHKFQAGDVRGVKGGKLFCETRHEHRATQEGAGASTERSDRGRTQVRGRGGSASASGSGRVDSGGRGRSEWMLVRSDQGERSQPRGNYGGGRGRGGRGGGARVEGHSERQSSRTQSTPATAPAPACHFVLPPPLRLQPLP